MARKTKARPNPKQEIIGSAVNIGVGEIIKLHPRFINSGHYIANHLNSQSLNEMFDKLYTTAQKNKVSKDKIGEYITIGLANYISSGGAFDHTGKETILKTSLEAKAGKGFIRGMSARRELAGDKYLDQIISAWSEVNEIAKAGGQELPEEIARPMQYLSRLGFAIPAAEILEENGLISRHQYSQIKDNIKKGAYESHREATQRLEGYSRYQKAAALIIGFLGLGIIAFSSGITGAVIGAPVKFAGGFSGIVLVIISCILLMISSNKR